MHKIRQNERYGGLIQGVELLLILYARLGFALFELLKKKGLSAYLWVAKHR